MKWKHIPLVCGLYERHCAIFLWGSAAIAGLQTFPWYPFVRRLQADPQLFWSWTWKRKIMKRTLTHSLLRSVSHLVFWSLLYSAAKWKACGEETKGWQEKCVSFLFVFFFFPPRRLQVLKTGEKWQSLPPKRMQIRRLRLNLLHLLLPGTHSEFTSGRCFHIERGARPRWGRSQHIGNRHILLTASGGKDRIGLCSTEGTGDWDEGDMNGVVCACVRRWWVHLHDPARCACCVFFKSVWISVRAAGAAVFRRAHWQTVSWLMSSCRPSLFMSPVTHLPSQSSGTWNPETPKSLISTAVESTWTSKRDRGRERPKKKKLSHASTTWPLCSHLFAKRRGSVEPKDFNEIQMAVLRFKRNEALVYSDTAKFSISASLHFHLPLIQEHIWGDWQEIAVWCVLEEIDGELGVFTKDLWVFFFFFFPMHCVHKRKKDIPVRESSPALY